MRPASESQRDELNTASSNRLGFLNHTYIWLLIKVIEQHQKRVPQEIFIVLNNSTLHLKNILQSQEENKVSYN